MNVKVSLFTKAKKSYGLSFFFFDRERELKRGMFISSAPFSLILLKYRAPFGSEGVIDLLAQECIVDVVAFTYVCNIHY